ncbi:hypothetical protein I6A84_00785 [Frankia sp. CNm7]|uniref:Uncharacterized protein n=1 Tax=Frankia nepalensis TaxID=1836974 RepID=A0A937RHF9_9ACTN|nr:hypothetical protein [Frankia nepalensis]MBL7496689.1 hypothetical protein [Frankia nepalensis]MBL7511081.1 hypothetical protein [Frankia nepalensis]MBL7516697.1 hypothetical protein [Frankia nepalensis]MBL7627429.1 hypothetical protein [Frankia nepalensis]
MGSQTLRPGARLSSQVCQTQVIVVRGGGGAPELGCGGAPLVGQSGAATEPALPADAALLGGSPLGKRFVVPGAPSVVELLVTRAGEGTLTADGVAMVEKEAAKLPSSD